MKSITKLSQGLEILAKHEGTPAAEHDIVYVISTLKNDPENGDVKQLLKMGWHFSSEYGCWAKFV